MITDETSARSWLAQLPEWDKTAADRLTHLAALLTEENQRQNLVSQSSLAEIWRRHIADSAQLLVHVPRETSTPWLDLGTGAGFPGLVIACMRPELDLRMVESRTRRIEWLERACTILALDNARVVGRRLELVESFCAATISARAFAPLEKLVQLSARFSTATTCWLLPKGQSARDELASLRGWAHMFHVEQSLTDPAAGVIVGTLEGRTGKRR